MHRRSKQSWISDGKTEAAFWTWHILYGPSSSFDSGCVYHHKSGQKISDLTRRKLSRESFAGESNTSDEVVRLLLKCGFCWLIRLWGSKEGVSTPKKIWPVRYFLMHCTVEDEAYNPPRSRKKNSWKDNGPMVVNNSLTKPASLKNDEDFRGRFRFWQLFHSLPCKEGFPGRNTFLTTTFAQTTTGRGEKPVGRGRSRLLCLAGTRNRKILEGNSCWNY